MKSKLALLLVLLASVAAAYYVGYVKGCNVGNLRSYAIGFEHGQSDGILTAQSAYESGGEIVNLTTGQVTQKAARK